MTRTQNRYHLRLMIRRDMPEMLDIERASFPHPWCEADFYWHLRAKEKTYCLVAEADSTSICGYAVYRNTRQTVELLNLAVCPWVRRCGVATALLDRLKGKLICSREKLIALVRETNLPAQLWLRANGFICEQVKRQPYDDTPEDGLAFSFRKEWR